MVSSAYWESLISRSAIWIPFISHEALIAIDSISTAKTNSNPDKGQPCLTPRCNSNQFDAYPLLIVQLVIFVYKILTQDLKS